jgi:hypothetical protein
MSTNVPHEVNSAEEIEMTARINRTPNSLISSMIQFVDSMKQRRGFVVEDVVGRERGPATVLTALCSDRFFSDLISSRGRYLIDVQDWEAPSSPGS